MASRISSGSAEDAVRENAGGFALPSLTRLDLLIGD